MWPEILVYIYMYTDIYLDEIYIIHIHLILHIIHKKTLHVRLNNCPNVTSFCNTFLCLKGSEKTYTLCDLPEGRRDRCTTVLLNYDFPAARITWSALSLVLLWWVHPNARPSDDEPPRVPSDESLVEHSRWFHFLRDTTSTWPLVGGWAPTRSERLNGTFAVWQIWKYSCCMIPCCVEIFEVWFLCQRKWGELNKTADRCGVFPCVSYHSPNQVYSK